jgi:hypothetical protein
MKQTDSRSGSSLRSLSPWIPFVIAIAIVLVAGAVILFAVSQLLAKERAPIAGVTPTGVVNPAPSVKLSPAEGEPGSIVTVTGAGWQPGDALAIYLDRFDGDQASRSLVAQTVASSDGTFSTSFVYSSAGSPQPAGPQRLLVTVASTATGAEALALFQVTTVASPTQGPSATPGPGPSPSPTPDASQPPRCTDSAAFVTDVTIPDNAQVAPVQSFVKTWRLRNSGTCTWNSDYALVFSRGDQMGGPTSVAVHGTVLPGATIDLSANLTAPAAPGTYRGDWQLRNAGGDLFGLESSTGPTFWVKIVVKSGATPLPTATPTPTPGTTTWRTEYYGNRALSGIPLVRDEVGINFDWGNGSPAVGLPVDNFSARWTRTLAFQAGTYRFYAQSDDGVRVWLDGQLLIDEWHDASGTVYSAERTLATGSHTVRIEYFENLGDARLRFWWERPADFPQWRGDYYTNMTLSGSPTLTRNDPTLDFSWGAGSPVGLPADGFSVRWTRTLALEDGLYRFRAVMDDGMRLYVDDRLVINEWRDGAQREISGEVRLAAGFHTVRVEYYERTGDAVARVGWEKVASYPDWKGEYWSSRNLSGAPAAVRNDVRLDFDWARGAPAAGLPVDNFSARWTRTVNFDSGTFRFRVLVDDGARLWLDDRLIIDSWRDGSVREVTADRALTGGSHSVRLEYYENSGDARVRLSWEKVSASYPDWKGEYWSNRDLSNNPALIRNDQSIDFSWGTGSAATGLPADNWSVRWSRSAALEPGVYRFYATADDGIRFYLDGRLLLNEWHDSSGGEVYTVDLAVSGSQQLVVEYYEHSGEATARFWWRRIGPLPTATATRRPTTAPTATPTVTPTRLPTTAPTSTPTATPTQRPTEKPSEPTEAPTATATATQIPPSPTPTATATQIPPSPTPTSTPTKVPTPPTRTPTPLPKPEGVRLNEIFPVPALVISSRDVKENGEWIELYNAGRKAFDLSGWWLDDGDDETPPYQFPRRTMLRPRGYLVLYQGVTGLSLDDGGDTVRLIRPAGQVAEEVTFGPLSPNASYSRDEQGLWHSDWPPSPGAPNSPFAIAPGLEPALPGLGLHSVPAPQ